MWLLLAFGCRGAEVATFLDDRAVAICARHEACGTLERTGYTSEADCLAALDAATRSLTAEGALACASFDADAADTCLDTYATTPCETPPDLAVCDAVCP